MAFPVAALEKDDADGGHGGFGDYDRPIDAVGLHRSVDGEEISERNFQHPEGEEIDDGGRDGVRIAGGRNGAEAVR